MDDCDQEVAGIISVTIYLDGEIIHIPFPSVDRPGASDDLNNPAA
jgi:hypothetical protein